MIRICWSIVVLAFAGACAGRAAIVADWTFEGSVTSSTGNGYIYGAADTGLNTAASSASGLHVSALTQWSFPAGNGSPQGFDADHWAVGDYFQFSVSTVGFNQIIVTFDQISSSTGPGKFLFEYSTDGTIFTSFGSDYTITGTSWSSSSHTGSTTFSNNLASISELDNKSTVVFRLVDDSMTSESGGTVGTAGASHVDNFIINGNAVPEPSAWGAIAGAGSLTLCGWRVWRQRRCEEKLKS
jgi:hypothetical protein